uniref:Uncharacterized protein n=1 Tax=Romanomermis culicivorax TaxID=13658 RepID=A0A915HTR0_ROMCU
MKLRGNSLAETNEVHPLCNQEVLFIKNPHPIILGMSQDDDEPSAPSGKINISFWVKLLMASISSSPSELMQKWTCRMPKSTKLAHQKTILVA